MKSIRIILLLFITIICLNQANSQVSQKWTSRFNGPAGLADRAGSVAVDGSGNVYVTGYSAGIGTGDDYSTLKYDSSGVLKWEARYDGPGNSTDAAYQIKVDASGNVYVTGKSRSGTIAATEDFATIKYNSIGVQQWVRRYNGPGNSEDIAYNIAIDGSGNVYVTGSSTGSGTDNDYVTIKYNSSGDSLWVKRYNGPGNSIDNSYRITVSDSGNVYVTGYSRSGSSPGSEDCTTIKYNSAGVQQWVQRFNNGANEIGLGIAVDAAGNTYVAGFAWNGFSSLDYLTIKYNSSGIQLWSRIEVSAGINVVLSLAVDNPGNVYVTGYSFNETTGNDDYLTIKYNSSGSFQWESKYNGPGNGADTAFSLAVDGTGNVYVTGSSSGSGSGTDYTTVKYNSSGVQHWVERYNGTGNSADAAFSLTVDSRDYVYVTGVSAGIGSGADYETIKYSQTSSLFTLDLTVLIEGFYNSVSNTMISDTAAIYLKNSSPPFNTLDSSRRKLSTLGAAPFMFSNAVNGVSYYLSVKHRNSLETWSSSPIIFTSGSSNYNFTTVSTQAYGNNMKQVDLSPLKFAVYSGDKNLDGFINLSDLLDVYNAAGSFISGYVSSDINGNNVCDLTDVLIVYNNSVNFVSLIRP